MTDLTIAFADPTIPGLSGRDLVERATHAVRTRTERIGSAFNAARRDLALRQDMARLDRELLRDIGLDQGAA